MAGNFDELKELLNELLTNRFAPKPAFTRGLLGDGLGNVVVPDRPDKNYVRFNRGSTEFFEVFNVTVNAVNDWPILIGELPWLPGLTQVVGTDWAAYEQSGWNDNVGATSPHSPTHEWPDGTPGSDAVNIYMRSIVPLRAYTLGTGSTTIYVNSYEYENPNGSGSVWGGLPGLDLAPIMSSMTTGTARLMGIYLDPSINTLGIVTGVSDIFTDASDPPSPQYPRGILPVARIRVYGGQASIGEIDIRDTRQPFGFLPTGTVGAGYPFSIITVDDSDTDADYDNLEDAITAATTGDTILFNGTFTITDTSVNINKAITVQGFNPESSIITSALEGDDTVVLSTLGAVLRDCKAINTASTGTSSAVALAIDGAECYNVEAEYSGTGTIGYGFNLNGGAGSVKCILEDCVGTSSGATTNHGLNTSHVAGAIIIGGRYNGTEADIAATAGIVELKWPCFENSLMNFNSGSEVTGVALDEKGRDAGFIALNSSGANADKYDVGYLDTSREYKTTTTSGDIENIYVVSIGGSPASGWIFVQNRGNATVNYAGVGPSGGDYLITSTTAGSAAASATAHYAAFAQCRASGIGGVVEANFLEEPISGDITVDLYQAASIAKTTNFAKCKLEGMGTKAVHIAVRVTSTASGTAANNIYILLPAALLPAQGSSPLGTAIYDVTGGGGHYQGVAALVALTGGLPSIAMFENTTNDGNVIGVTPNIAVASGDVYSMELSFEIA